MQILEHVLLTLLLDCVAQLDPQYMTIHSPNTLASAAALCANVSETLPPLEFRVY